MEPKKFIPPFLNCVGFLGYLQHNLVAIGVLTENFETYVCTAITALLSSCGFAYTAIIALLSCCEKYYLYKRLIKPWICILFLEIVASVCTV